jgi:hypothetical protein
VSEVDQLCCLPLKSSDYSAARVTSGFVRQLLVLTAIWAEVKAQQLAIDLACYPGNDEFGQTPRVLGFDLASVRIANTD